MLKIRLGMTLLTVALAATGCSRFIDNGSLDHKTASSLPPLQLPNDIQARSPTPLYPAPRIDEAALQNTPDFVSKNGKRFELPRPKLDTPLTTATLSQAVGKAVLVQDGNQNPLLKIEGDANSVWRYTLATLSTLNLKAQPSDQGYDAQVVYQDQTFTLRLSSSGTSNTLAVLDAKRNFANAEIAMELLTQISQNWPA